MSKNSYGHIPEDAPNRDIWELLIRVPLPPRGKRDYQWRREQSKRVRAAWVDDPYNMP